MTTTGKRMRPPVAMARGLGIALGAGAAAALLARLLYAALPDPWITLVNTSALWGLVPFAVVVVTAVRSSRAAVLGQISLLTMVVLWAVLAPEPHSPRVYVLWAVVAIGAGALCGLAGDLAGRRHPLAHRVGLAVMSGLILGEAFYGLVLIGGPQWWAEGAVGVLLALGGGRRWPDRMLALALATLLAGALFAAYLLFDAIAAG